MKRGRPSPAKEFFSELKGFSIGKAYRRGKTLRLELGQMDPMTLVFKAGPRGQLSVALHERRQGNKQPSVSKRLSI